MKLQLDIHASCILKISRVKIASLRSLITPLFFLSLLVLRASAQGVSYDGRSGPGHGKNLVLIAGDDGEYHSEEALPQLAEILAVRHGFHCTVLFPLDADGTINPHQNRDLQGLEALRKADLVVLFMRWRDLPDSQMKMLIDYVQSGRPILAIRTGTHPFALKTSKNYEKWSWDSTIPGWEGGFGRKVLGETWVAHHGQHGKQSTRAWFAQKAAGSPILHGIENGGIWVPTEVYEVRLPMLPTCHPLLVGQVLSALKPDDAPVAGKANDPMIPVAWTNSYTAPNGKMARIFVSTMGAADDLLNEQLRRLLVNATYWAVGLEDKIPAQANVNLVGDYHPHSYLSETYTKGVKPADLAMKK
jgi:hypothetical protein